MVASMASVSFAITLDRDTFGYASTEPSLQFSKTDGFTSKNDKDGAASPVVDAYGPFSYDDDEKALMRKVVEYGDTAYYALISDTGMTGDGISYAAADRAPGSFAFVTDSEVVSSLKVKAKWEEGSDLVQSVSIVKKKVTNDSSTTRKTENDLLIEPHNTVFGDNKTGVGGNFNYDTAADEYYYFIAVKIKSSDTTADSDVIGTLTLNKSKHPKVDDLELDIAFNVDWDNSYRNVSTLEVTGDIDVKAEINYALKFNDDAEIDINFADDSIFTVDVSGQGKVLLYYDTEFDSKVAAQYPMAEFNFWNGNGAKFNRVGEFFLSCDSDYAQFIYQVNADGTLSEVPGAEYDPYDEGFYFNTRVLGKYAISDMELELAPAKTETTTPAPEVTTPIVTPPVSNPSTGAVA